MLKLPSSLLTAILLCAGSALAQAPGVPQAPPPQEQEGPAFRATHYEIHASLNTDAQALIADAKVDFEASAPSHVIEVELHPNLRVSDLRSKTTKILSYDRDVQNPMILRVMLADPVVTGGKVSLEFTYAGPLANDENSPVRGVTLASITKTGAFLLLPARWFPLTNFPANRFTADYSLDVPQDFAVAGTGMTSAVPTVIPGKGGQPQRLLYVFHADQPEASGTFVAGALQLSPTRVEGLDISVYTAPTLVATAQAYAQSVSHIEDFFSDQWGPLPQPSLTVAQLMDGSLPSFAAPGLLLISQRNWAQKPDEHLLANLIASQWWGGQVAPETVSDGWITDGLARYSESLYVEDSANKDAMNRVLEEFAVGALMFEGAAPVAEAGRLQPYTDQYNSVVINKGAMVFHMLRAQMGDDAFRALLKQFYTKYTGHAASDADFENMAVAAGAALPPAAGAGSNAPPVIIGNGPRTSSDSSGPLNLRPFFAQWVHSTGVPEFKLDYVVYRTQKGFKIVGKVGQNLDFFHMPMELEVETEGNPEYKTIDVVGTSSSFVVDTFGRPKPNGVHLDPHDYVLKSSPELRIRAIIARGENLAQQGRFYDAVRQYQQALDQQKTNALANFRMGEAFFYEKNYAASAQSFRDSLDGDYDSTTKWVVVWSHIYLGKIYDISGERSRAVNEYQKAKQTADDTGGAQAEAQKYIAKPYA
ncbi:MAG: M1 family aminopeptidase [Candidatus Acidiferrales bacterium]